MINESYFETNYRNRRIANTRCLDAKDKKDYQEALRQNHLSYNQTFEAYMKASSEQKEKEKKELHRLAMQGRRLKNVLLGKFLRNVQLNYLGAENGT